jgi:vanillate O-demethylase ferredoxin subunit
VHLAPGLIRQYSLCNSPRERHRYLIAVKKEPQSRGGSLAMHALVEGRALTISQPRNNFSLHPSASHHVLLAGGIGVTPVLSMAHELLSTGTSFELLYFTRSNAHTAFAAVLSSEQFEGYVQLHPAVQAGALEALLRRLLARPPADTHAYVCGPPPFMDLVTRVAAEGLPAGAIHKEYFAAAPAPQPVHDAAFQVRLARTGRTYDVGAGQTIVAALAAHGVNIATSCEQGVCGTCITDVLEGVPDHRDLILSGDEKAAGNLITPCVSRSKTNLLVLDV